MAHKSQMKDLDKKAAKIISRENTMHLAIRRGTRVVLNLCRAGSKRKGTVDLHGLYVLEALEYAKKRLQSATYRDDDKVCFMLVRPFSF